MPKPDATARVRKWRSQPENRRRENIANRARTKAWVELARRHRAEFIELFDQKKVELEQEMEES